MWIILPKYWVLFMIFGPTFNLLSQSSPINVSEDQTDRAFKGLQRAVTFTEPTQPLEFRKSVKRRPRRKNLKTSRLLRKMGSDYKKEWMSIDEPVNVDETKVEMSEDQISKLIEQVNGLKLDQELKELNAGSNNPMDSQTIAIFQQWLVQKSSCPVNYHWIDLGDYFWPKWIRQGSCQNSATEPPMLGQLTQPSQTKHCSWPNGMKCVQGDVEMLQILRWHCRKRHNKRPKRKCKWYKIPYPVTSSCKCACSL